MIAASVPCSFIDYPGELSAVLFTQGCDLRCRYCHNPGLCPPVSRTSVSLEETKQFLISRKGKLTAVTVTGGEPTLHKDLPGLLSFCRKLGFAVKLDTNGMRPLIVRDLARSGLVSYVAVDVKTAPGVDATRLTGAANQGALALETLAHAVEAGVDCEARTTVLRPDHDAIVLRHTAQCLAAAGVKTWRLQPVESAHLSSAATAFEPPSEATLSTATMQAASLGIDTVVRRGRAPATLPTNHPRRFEQA